MSSAIPQEAILNRDLFISPFPTAPALGLPTEARPITAPVLEC